MNSELENIGSFSKNPVSVRDREQVYLNFEESKLGYSEDVRNVYVIT